MKKLTAIDNGDFINLNVDGVEPGGPCFTINRGSMEWGTAPCDNRPTWEWLCEQAGLDPDNADGALNKAAGLTK